MKSITNYLLKFALVATVLSIFFRYFLSYGIDNKSTFTIILSATLYGVGMFASGWHFGKKEWHYLPLYDVGFRFHFTTYLIHNLISELWFLFGYNSHYERVNIVHTTAIIWGIFICFHFIMFLKARKTTINNLDKSDLFE